MINRKQIIKEICDNFFISLITTSKELGMEDGEMEGMRIVVTEFIRTKAKEMNDEDLLIAFGNQHEILDSYIAFLETKLAVGKKTKN
jgi:hypothetical protein